MEATLTCNVNRKLKIQTIHNFVINVQPMKDTKCTELSVRAVEVETTLFWLVSFVYLRDIFKLLFGHVRFVRFGLLIHLGK